jgi:uncharacterized protein (TIGR00730 family)
MKRICVYCGSSPGAYPKYMSMAQDLGHAIAERGIELVYGGGSVGLMGGVANAVLDAGGTVHGIIPRGLFDREVPHRGLNHLYEVGSMHERKSLMASLSDGFMTLPGGIGTLEELFESWSWIQLGIYKKPCGLLNMDGYYNHLIQFLEHTSQQGFVRRTNLDMVVVDSDPVQLLDKLIAYQPALVSRWMGEDEI